MEDRREGWLSLGERLEQIESRIRGLENKFWVALASGWTVAIALGVYIVQSLRGGHL